MPATFINVFVDGRELTGEFSPGSILDHIEARQELNEHWRCEVVCRQTLDRRFPIEEALGKSLTIQTVSDAGTTTLFDGIVLDGRLVWQIFGNSTARLVGISRSYKLDVTPRQAYYLGK